MTWEMVQLAHEVNKICDRFSLRDREEIYKTKGVVRITPLK